MSPLRLPWILFWHHSGLRQYPRLTLFFFVTHVFVHEVLWRCGDETWETAALNTYISWNYIKVWFLSLGITLELCRPKPSMGKRQSVAALDLPRCRGARVLVTGSLTLMHIGIFFPKQNIIYNKNNKHISWIDFRHIRHSDFKSLHLWPVQKMVTKPWRRWLVSWIGKWSWTNNHSPAACFARDRNNIKAAAH